MRNVPEKGGRVVPTPRPPPSGSANGVNIMFFIIIRTVINLKKVQSQISHNIRMKYSMVFISIEQYK